MLTYQFDGTHEQMGEYAGYLARHAHRLEETPSGVEFAVSDKMQSDEGVVAYRPQDAEDKPPIIVVDQAISRDVRPHIAEVASWSLEGTDKYTTADAVQTKNQSLLPKDPGYLALDASPSLAEEFEAAWGLKNDVIRTLLEVLVAHRSRYLARLKQLGRQSVSAAVRDQLYFGLGRAQDEGFYIVDDEATAVVMWLQVRKAWKAPPEAGTGECLMARAFGSENKTEEIGIYRTTERGDRHTCAECRSHIYRGTDRITRLLPPSMAEYSTHDHLHMRCYMSKTPTLDIANGSVQPTPEARLQNMGARGRQLLVVQNRAQKGKT